MSTTGRGNFKMALASVRSTKWRSMLTMLGVVIGIVSVVTIVGIGEGVKLQVAGQTDRFGKDLITVRPGVVHAQDGKELVANTDVLFGRSNMNGLTMRDVEAVRKARHIRHTAPLGTVSGTLSFDGRKASDTIVVATSGDLDTIINQKIEYGDFFTNDPNSRSAVIGQDVAMRLFDERVPLGQTFVFRGQSFTVRGVFAKFHASPLSPTAHFDNAVFLPYHAANAVTHDGVQFYAILAKPGSPGQLKPALGSVQQAMAKSHDGEHDFSVLDQKASIAAASSIVDLLTTFITAVAVIALIVGGVGIMNIMLVSVTERMHEIGIRKAIGATNRQILGQFILEAVVLSGVGGAVGVAVSVVLAWLLRTYTDYQPVITWQPIVIATLVSVGIGVLFGAAPAIKAARKDPIEALRHE